MKPSLGYAVLSMMLVGVSAGACHHSSAAPKTPTNHSPLIASVTLFPTTIGPSDSAIVVLEATDSDGDTLVYDWIGDGRVRLKDAPRGGYIFSSPRNYQTFYYATTQAPLDTAFIRCYVRDQRGGQDGRLILLFLHS